MKIQSSEVTMQAAASTVSTRKDTLTLARFRSRTDIDIGKMLNLPETEDGDAVQNARGQRNLRPEIDSRTNQRAGIRASAIGLKDNGISSSNDYRLELLEKMLESILKRKFKLRNINDILMGGKSISAAGQPLQNALPARDNGAGIVQTTIFLYKADIYTKESLSFAAAGNLTTEDGRTIDFNIELNMSREFYMSLEAAGMTQEMVRFCDPLIINYDAVSAGLSGEKFSFDLDCDGSPDQISKLLSGSGFLAFDKNGDGIINDGNELFGATSGNGFRDLAVYDEDGNDWIDENDSIFHNLRIWTFNEKGENVLLGLGEAGIGAIYLGNVSTGMSIRDNNEINGMLRSTGVFLFESGTAGTIQHVDFVI